MVFSSRGIAEYMGVSLIVRRPFAKSAKHRLPSWLLGDRRRIRRYPSAVVELRDQISWAVSQHELRESRVWALTPALRLVGVERQAVLGNLCVLRHNDEVGGPTNPV